MWLVETPRSGAARVASEVSRGLPKAALMPPTIAPRLRCASGGDPTAQSDGHVSSSAAFSPDINDACMIFSADMVIRGPEKKHLGAELPTAYGKLDMLPVNKLARTAVRLGLLQGQK